MEQYDSSSVGLENLVEEIEKKLNPMSSWKTTPHLSSNQHGSSCKFTDHQLLIKLLQTGKAKLEIRSTVYASIIDAEDTSQMDFEKQFQLSDCSGDAQLPRQVQFKEISEQSGTIEHHHNVNHDGSKLASKYFQNHAQNVLFNKNETWHPMRMEGATRHVVGDESHANNLILQALSAPFAGPNSPGQSFHNGPIIFLPRTPAESDRRLFPSPRLRQSKFSKSPFVVKCRTVRGQEVKVVVYKHEERNKRLGGFRDTVQIELELPTVQPIWRGTVSNVIFVDDSSLRAKITKVVDEVLDVEDAMGSEFGMLQTLPLSFVAALLGGVVVSSDDGSFL